MDPSEIVQAMHAVLDGQATARQKLALDAALAIDPGAREEFHALRDLYDRLEREQAPYPAEERSAAGSRSSTT
jgi:anti-sigma factor RsiW